MKIVVFGDIHGRLVWDDIINKEKPDKVIFLGDYVSTHDNIPAEQQLANLEDIINYKEANPESVIMLRGNHDTQHLGYHWAECSGFDRNVCKYMGSSDFRIRFLDATKWIHVEEIGGEKYIFAHAGVSKEWLNYTNIKFEEINELGPDERFGFTSDNWYDGYGTSKTQSCVWIRPATLVEYAVDGYNQVVGHTPTDNIRMVQMENGNCLWLCDSLGYNNYLVIENNIFESRHYDE